MPKSKDQNKLIRDERREQILDAAMQVFAKKGFAATKISDIISITGLSHGLVYHYFKSKEELFQAVIQQTIELSREANGKLNLIPGDTLEKIRIFTERGLNNKTEEQGLRFLLMTQVYLSDSLPPEIKAMLDQSYAPVLNMTGLISEGQRNGEMISDENPKMLATAYWAMFIGLMLMKMNDSETFIQPGADIILRLFKK